MEIKIKKLHPDAVIPYKTYDTDFCYDCVATSCEEIAPHVFKYGLGFALELPKRYASLRSAVTFRPRSSIWKTGMVLSNAPGTGDQDYRGELSAVFYHLLTDMPPYKVGDRVCQMHVDRTQSIKFTLVDKLSPTRRGDKGYGSTGK